jgi:hypothetical protein
MNMPLPTWLMKVAFASVRRGPGSRSIPRETSQGSRREGDSADTPPDARPAPLPLGFSISTDRHPQFDRAGKEQPFAKAVFGRLGNRSSQLITAADLGVWGRDHHAEKACTAGEESHHVRERLRTGPRWKLRKRHQREHGNSGVNLTISDSPSPISGRRRAATELLAPDPGVLALLGLPERGSARGSSPRGVDSHVLVIRTAGAV